MQTANRIDTVKDMAETIAMDLIKNNLASDDTDLGDLCAQLQPFHSILTKKKFSDPMVLNLVQTGLAMVSIDLQDEASDRAEAIRLCGELAKKASSMLEVFG